MFAGEGDGVKNNMRDKILLHQLQALPLDAKILMTQQRIREWYNHFNGDVYISFSGGKDSTVLTHLVHSMYPDVPLVFANTGLEYPEIQAFAKKMGAEFIRPKMSFSEVISAYGYPIISKEVAEAIHFARRIVPPEDNLYGGGGYNSEQESTNGKILHYKRSRTELHGERDDTERIAARKNRMETGESYRTDTVTQKFEGGGTQETRIQNRQYPTRDRLNLLGKRGFGSVKGAVAQGGLLNGLERQTNAPSKDATPGEKQIGKGGKEKQLPG